MSEAHFLSDDPSYFLDMHETVLTYQGDHEPIDVTNRTGVSLAEGRVALSATVEPPTLVVERRNFVRISGQQGFDVLRLVVQLDDGAQKVIASERLERQERTLSASGRLQSLWSGPREARRLPHDELEHRLDQLYDMIERVDEEDDEVLKAREE